MTSDHFIQVAYTTYFSNNPGQQRKAPIKIVSRNDKVLKPGEVKNFSSSKGSLLNSFDKKENNSNYTNNSDSEIRKK